MRKYEITAEEYEAVKRARKANRDKRVDRRLAVIQLRYEGLKDREISEKLDFNRKVVSQLCGQFKKRGLEEYSRNNYSGNHRNLSREEESEVLETMRQKAEAGEIITVWEIRAALEGKLGRETRPGYVYDVLRRNKWRQVMPRPKHPKSASPEAVEASKKLTNKPRN